MSIAAKPGAGISSFAITEGGAYAIDDGTTATFASETLVINNLFITSVNGVGVNPIVVTPTITFTHTGTAPTAITSDSITFLGGDGLENGSWSAVASFNLPAALAQNGLQGTVTGLSLALDNQLGAQADSNGSAFIDKKNFLITPGPSSPEPGTLGLVGLGLTLGLRRRKN
jgi:PEP-CTERM motif